MTKRTLFLSLFLLVVGCQQFGNVLSSSSAAAPTSGVLQQQQQEEENGVGGKVKEQVLPLADNNNVTVPSGSSNADSQHDTEDNRDKEKKTDPQQQKPKTETKTTTNQEAASQNATTKDIVSMKEFVHIQKNLDECLLQSHQQTSQLSAKVVQTEQLHEKMTAFESKLASVQSNYDSLVQSSEECRNERRTLLQENQDLLKKVHGLQEKYDSRTSDFQKEKEEMQVKFEVLQEQYKVKNNEYYDAKEHIHRLEKELQSMYDKSETTYINMSLIVQDLGWEVMKRIDNAVDFLERFYHSKTVVEVQSKVKEVTQPLWKKCLDLYNVHHGEDLVRSMQERLYEIKAMERARLTLVNVVQHGCKIVLNYMDMTGMLSEMDSDGVTTDKKENKETPKAPWYAAVSYEKLQRKSKTRPRVNSLVIKGMQYAQQNTEQVVESGIWVGALLSLVVVLSLVWRVIVVVFQNLFGTSKKRNVVGNTTRTNKRNGKQKKGPFKNKVE